MSGRQLLTIVFGLFLSTAAFAATPDRELPFPLPHTIKPEDSAAYQTKLLDWLKANKHPFDFAKVIQ